MSARGPGGGEGGGPGWWVGRGYARDCRLAQPGRGELGSEVSLGVDYFALGFIPVYSNLSMVAMRDLEGRRGEAWGDRGRGEG